MLISGIENTKGNGHKPKPIVFDEETGKPRGGEFAANVTDIFLNAFVFGFGSNMEVRSRGRDDTFPNPDLVLRDESLGRYYELYERMEQTDPHYFSQLEIRKKALLGKPWAIVPSEIDPRAEEHADFIKRMIDLIPRWRQFVYELMDAIAKGYKACEVIWDTQAVALQNGQIEQRVIVKEIKGRPQRRFVFSLAGALKLLNPQEQWSQGFVFTSTPMGTKVPARKFIVAQFDKQDDAPYGNGLARKVYWYYWFKKSLIKYAMIFADKFGMPTAVGAYESGLGQTEKDELMVMLRNMQQDSVVIYPKGTEVSLMEAQRSGTIGIYKDLLEYLDDAISKAVLGQTLSSSEGRRSGSLALGEVHADVRQDILEDDAVWVADIINSTIIRWALDFNFANVIDPCRIKWQVEKTESQEQRGATFSSAKNMGMEISKTQVREELKLKEPLDDDDKLEGGFGAAGEEGKPGGPFGQPERPKPGESKPAGGEETPPANPEEENVPVAP